MEFQADRILNPSRDPEHEACRVLYGRGIRGRITFIHQHGTPGMLMDIERRAGLTVKDRDGSGLSIEKYAPPVTPVTSPASVAA